jgi:hypothetical protein
MVYILYLDASGDSGVYQGKNTKHFVLTGVACRPIVSRMYSSIFAGMLRKYFPDKNERPKKIRYYDLIHERKPWNSIDRKNFADEFFKQILRGNAITLFSMIINKEAHYKQYSDPENPYNLALDMMITRYQWFLEQKNEYGLVVSDREDNNIMKILSDLFEKFKHKGTEYAELQNIVDTLFFAPSETCPMLEAADFCSYAFFSKYEHNKTERYDQIKHKIYKNYGEYKHPNR